MKVINFCNKVIEYSFYLLFLLVPLVFMGNTSELFEFNKMWLTFGLTIIIATAWFIKMVLQRRVFIQRTPLDIFLLLFLLSQTLSTLMSLDSHVSWWGYYSRFNGGLLSTITYIFLYYAFVSNMDVKRVIRVLKVSLIAGALTAFWGLPSHFGYDPTCLLFRGTLDTSCWTEAFKPTVRIFSTLGQPAWLAAYVTVLLPLSIAFFLNNLLPHIKQNNKHQEAHKNHIGNRKYVIRSVSFLILAVLFYLCLIFTNTRAGFIALAAADIILWILVFAKKFYTPKLSIKFFLIFHGIFLLCNFFFWFPVGSLNKFTFVELTKQQSKPSLQQSSKEPAANKHSEPAQTISDNGITDSGDIRLIVWKGAIEAWKSSPLFGSGPETFAYAYYKFRPPEHNLTSEWDYLYNKAHNEYLNYLTTTGLFGLGTYLLFICAFIFLFLKNVLSKSQNEIPPRHQILAIGLFAGFISTLITNFLGFSVVIMNLYLFLIPAFVFMLLSILNPDNALSFGQSMNQHVKHSHVNPYQWTAIVIFIIISGFLHFDLLRYWQADIAYALGANLNKVQSYQEAYPLLLQAAQAKPNEPVYMDELSINIGTLAAAFFLQKDTDNASQLAKQAITLNNHLVERHPNNVVFWKNRFRLFYTLAQGDPVHQQQYYAEALKATEKAHELAPTDAKISYNLGVLYGQTGSLDKAVDALEKTTVLKPDYRDAYLALGLVYHELALDKPPASSSATTNDENRPIINQAMQQKAINTYEYILKNLSPDDEEVKKTLKNWGV